MKILVIDNYDSFVYNLIYLLRQYPHITVDVVKNDHISREEVAQYDKILLSPGPGVPEEAGQMMALIQEYAPTKDILGVCLGHQALGIYAGLQLKQLEHPLHGIATPMVLEAADPFFQGIDNLSPIGHYHSWVLEQPNEMVVITAKDTAGNIMAFRHRDYQLRGVQFHPESILTTQGKQMIENWIKL